MDLSLVRDITERKRVEETLRTSEEKYQMLADNSQDMIYRRSLPGGSYEFVSPAAEQLTGYTPEEYYANPVLIQKHIHPDSREYFGKMWDALQNGDIPTSYEYRIIDRAGRARWLHQRNVLIRNDAGNSVAIEGVVTDMMENRNAAIAFQTMVSSMIGTTGLSLLRKITESVSSWLGTECVMVGEIQPDWETVRVLSMFLDGKESP